jgi:hypothetical protein
MEPTLTEKVLLIAEDDLRRRICEMSPEIRRSVDHMSELITEMVKLEREKAGLDKTTGTLELLPNKDKKCPADPDLTGWATVAGRHYRAAAWLAASGDKLKISLLPRK